MCKKQKFTITQKKKKRKSWKQLNKIFLFQCDWYWGPISGDAAEQVLSNEPDGSFLVRDSSDDRYIFSLTFKLNGTVRHVRIEHDQGKRL